MLGRGKHQTGDDEGVAVDASLEQDIETIEKSIDAYLKNPSVDSRYELLAVLERLDQQIANSDAYEASVIGSGAVGFSTKGSVFGETSSASPAEEVPGSVLRAQMLLIKAAKREVTARTSDTLADVRAASQTCLQPEARNHPLISSEIHTLSHKSDLYVTSWETPKGSKATNAT